VRSSALGYDREMRRYWWWNPRRGGGGKARLWVERLPPALPPYPPGESTADLEQTDSVWGHYDTEEQVEELICALSEKNKREKVLKKKLATKQLKISAAMRRPLPRRLPLEPTLPVRRSSRLQQQAKAN